MSCSCYAQALVGMSLLSSRPLWEFDRSPMECFHHAVSLSTTMRVAWLLWIACGEPATVFPGD